MAPWGVVAAPRPRHACRGPGGGARHRYCNPVTVLRATRAGSGTLAVTRVPSRHAICVETCARAIPRCTIGAWHLLFTARRAPLLAAAPHLGRRLDDARDRSVV